jgi:hypothetical protein
MKRTLLVLTIALLPSCKALGAAFSGGGDPEVDAQAQAIGSAAGDAAGLITGNQLIDLGVTAAVAGAAGVYLRLKRKKKPAA